MNPVAMATPAVGILTAPTAVSIRCGSAGSWEGVASGCGQMLVPGPAALFTGFTNQASLAILLEVAWTQFKTPFTFVCLYLDSPLSRSNSLEPFS